MIPTYAHEAYVETTLNSVFAQTFREFEVVVVNDGSPDRTRERLKPWVESGRIRYLEQPNGGQSRARNSGIAQARGRYIALLDDDDLWEPHALETLVRALESKSGAVMAYGFAESFGLSHNYRVPTGPGPDGSARKAFLRGNHIVSPGQTLIEAQALREIGGLDTDLWGVDDWDLWLRLAERGEFVYAETRILNYRCHPQNASKNTRRHFANGLKLLHKHAGRLPLGRQWSDWWSCRKFIGLFTSITELSNASSARQAGDLRRQFTHLFWAARYHPPLVLTRRFWRNVRGPSSHGVSH